MPGFELGSVDDLAVYITEVRSPWLVGKLGETWAGQGGGVSEGFLVEVTVQGDLKDV